MGFEVTYICHPKKEDGVGYNLEETEEIKRKIGKPFDDSSLQDLANAVVAMMARRDKLVVDVKAHELVKNEVNFRESKDGKAIILKGKRFQLDGTIAPDPTEPPQYAQPIQAQPAPIPVQPQQPQQPQQYQQNGLQPHEMVQQQQQQNGLQPHEMVQQNRQPAAANLENLYNQPNASIAHRSTFDMSKVNRNKVMYWVYFEPYMWRDQASRFSFTEDKKYAVHAIIPSVTGKLDAQQIVLTDDKGNLIKIDEKFFTSAGGGLIGDDQGQFSGQPKGRRGHRKAKLMYDDELQMDAHPAQNNLPSHLQGIPLDNGQVPAELMRMPDFGRGLM